MLHQKTEEAALAAWSFKAVSGVALAYLAGVNPVYYAFVGLMVLDFATGLLAGWRDGELESSKSGVGLRKKAIQFILVGATEMLYRTLQHGAGGNIPDFPAGALVAGFYCFHEFISIVENADKLGVYIPPPLRAALKRLGEIEEKK